MATALFAAGLCFIPPTLLQGGDYVVQWKPAFQFLQDAVRDGRIPLWNPYVHLGRPYLADMANLAWYPPTYLMLLGENIGFFLEVWLHSLLAVFGMRQLARALGVGRWQGYLMAFTFISSGALTARWVAGELPNCWAICYLPYLLYYALRTEEPWENRRVAFYALLLASQLLCHPQVFWFCAIGQGVFIVFRAVRLPVRDSLREIGLGLGQFVTACLWGAGLIAAALMPFLELVQQSNRSGNSPAFANAFNLAWYDLLYLFNPLWAVTGARWETNLFIGTLVVLLGAAGLCRLGDRNVRGFVGMLVVALLIALGDRTPLFAVFCKYLPGYIAFRFHSRAALLIVVALIAGAGIFLSRPHPRLRRIWMFLFGIPISYGFILLVVLQSLDLVQGNWMIKKVITGACSTTDEVPVDDSFERELVLEMRKADLLRPSAPPPRVCMPQVLVPANYSMIHRYANFDANCPLFLLRPWNYLHAMLHLQPADGKNSLSSKVYTYGPFPYHDLSLAVGLDPNSGRLVLASNSCPRAMVVYGAKVADYRTIINRLVRGHDITESALLEASLSEALPEVAPWPGTKATIRRFEPNWVLVDVQARTNGLLVLDEVWYPGWRAEVDGRVSECVPANAWMRAVPVPPGRHEVRVYFRQNNLLRGLVVSFASLLLWGVAITRRRGQMILSAQGTGLGNKSAQSPVALPTEQSRIITAPSSGSSAYHALAVGLAVTAVSVLLGLVAMVKSQHERFCLSRGAETQATSHLRIAEVFRLRGQPAEAATHQVAAVRLAERACELVGYSNPRAFVTLARAYAAAARYNDALEAASVGREAARAAGYEELDEVFRKIIDSCVAAQNGGSRDEGQPTLLGPNAISSSPSGF